jgi:hypothetical protein
MARVELEDRWQTSLTPDAVLQAIERFCSLQSIKIISRQPGEIQGKQGSGFKTRLIGGWMADPAVFPKRLTIRFQPSQQGCEIHARMEESLGFGFLDAHFKSRYATFFGQWMGQLRRATQPGGAGDDIVEATVIGP